MNEFMLTISLSVAGIAGVVGSFWYRSMQNQKSNGVFEEKIRNVTRSLSEVKDDVDSIGTKLEVKIDNMSKRIDDLILHVKNGTK